MVPHMDANHTLVGTDRCIEIVFPDDVSRPGKRTFLEWKAQGYFRYRKIGRRVFYNPEEVAADLARRFRVEAININ
ncbi:MAG: hypothetical protein CMP31_13120 [Roseibacillus sp.]|jgi:hypothetical protein|nr:hypothetical protein [Roseibacillus sp.]